MIDRPILFSAPMVRAILAGTKTQTRRAVAQKWQRFANACHMPASVEIDGGGELDFPGRTQASFLFHNGIPIRDGEWQPVSCPYGQPGDRLLVRETFFAYGRWETRFSEKKGRDEWRFIDMTQECDRAYQYAADAPDVPQATGRGPLPGWFKRPAIHMPRTASRILLEVTAVRVERLQDISEADARAEGARECDPVSGREVLLASHSQRGSFVLHYRDIWEQINGRGSWDINPWVWVIEFRRIDNA